MIVQTYALRVHMKKIQFCFVQRSNTSEPDKQDNDDYRTDDQSVNLPKQHRIIYKSDSSSASSSEDDLAIDSKRIDIKKKKHSKKTLPLQLLFRCPWKLNI